MAIKLLSAFVIISSLLNIINTQITNSDSIYFDERGDYSVDNSYQPYREVIKQEANPLKIETDSYLAASTGILNGKGGERNFVNKVTPSIDLLPPPAEGPNNYYDASLLNYPQNTQQPQVASFVLDGRQKLDVKSNLMRSAESVTNFGFMLMNNIQKPEGKNVAISPYSIANTLALIQQGALGLTEQELSNVIGIRPDVAAQAFKQMSDSIKSKKNKGNIIKVANSLFVAPAFTLSQNFKSTAINNFGCEVSQLSFANSDTAANRINHWISEKTQNKIQSIVTPDSIGENTQLVLANAVYFKGLWKRLFNPQLTLQKDFYLRNGFKKTAAFMKIRGHFKTGFDPEINSKFLFLPFEDDQYSLVIIVPSENLSGAQISPNAGSKIKEYQNVEASEVLVQIPKFSIKDDTDLKELLRKMGVKEIFSPSGNLSGIGLYRNFSPQVSSATHSAFLSIDEKGGTAAASTVLAAVALSNDETSLNFVANLPFLAVLWDNELNLPIFIAKIEDPTL